MGRMTNVSNSFSSDSSYLCFGVLNTVLSRVFPITRFMNNILFLLSIFHFVELIYVEYSLLSIWPVFSVSSLTYCASISAYINSLKNSCNSLLLSPWWNYQHSSPALYSKTFYFGFLSFWCIVYVSNLHKKPRFTRNYLFGVHSSWDFFFNMTLAFCLCYIRFDPVWLFTWNFIYE